MASAAAPPSPDFPQIGGDRPLELGNSRRHDVKALEHAGKPFAEMAYDDLQVGKAVEHAAEDKANDMDANDMDRSLDVPAPTWAP
jgi:hypothetical protein